MPKKSIKNIQLTLKEASKSIKNILFAILGAFFVFLSAVWLPNILFIKGIIFSSSLSIQIKLSVLFNSLGAFSTNLPLSSQIFTIIISILFGINIMFFSYHINQKIKANKSLGVGVIGVISGMLGIGCASCGSIIISSLIGFGATVSFIKFLPLNGDEFGVLGIIILIFSITSIAKKTQEPQKCNI